MKVLCTSDWHMGIYGEPCDALKLSNSQLIEILDKWESEYDLILLNGDIFEVLKSARVKFSHYDQTLRVIENRQVLVERFTSSKKYLWVVGNHDYTLEKILGLPVKINMELDHGFTLIAEHGHLQRAPREHYSSYAWHFHLMYCMSWWIDKFGMKLSGHNFCLDSIISKELENCPNKNSSKHLQNQLKQKIISLAYSYASLNSDYGYASINELFWQQAKAQCNDSKTLVTFGHTHQRKIKYFGNNNVYVNTGSFCIQNQYSFVSFLTDSATVELVTI